MNCLGLAELLYPAHIIGIDMFFVYFRLPSSILLHLHYQVVMFTGRKVYVIAFALK
jgi:hypothetical protein